MINVKLKFVVKNHGRHAARHAKNVLGKKTRERIKTI